MGFIVKAKISFPDISTVEVAKPPEIPDIRYKTREINLEMPLDGLITEQHALTYIGLYCLKSSGLKSDILKQLLSEAKGNL